MENREIEKQITEILYKNSSDDSSHLRIKFENINNVIKLLVDVSNQQNKAFTDDIEELKSRISELEKIPNKVAEIINDSKLDKDAICKVISSYLTNLKQTNG